MKFRFILIGLAASLSLYESSYGQFVDVTVNSGVDHGYFDYQHLGGGVALFDADNDGLDDMYLVGGVGTDCFYHNLGQLQFEDLSQTSGSSNRVFSTGVCSADVDNDGFTDIILSTRAGQPLGLLLNNGDLTFTDASYVLNGILSWTMSISCGDVDNNGFVDIYAGGYVEAYNGVTLDSIGNVVEFNFDCYSNELYLNHGNLNFEEFCQSDVCGNQGATLATLLSDVDSDNDADIIVVNDFGQFLIGNEVFSNQFPSLAFMDESESLGFDQSIFGMSICQIDANRDGLIDYYVGNLGDNVLLLNQGVGTYLNQSYDFGVESGFDGDSLLSTWGVNALDFNNDGYEDLFCANGFVSAGSQYPNPIWSRNLLLVNTQSDFVDVTSAQGLENVQVSRGSAVSDLDNDGDMDIVVVSDSIAGGLSNRTKVYANSGSPTQNWMQINLRGTVSNFGGYGAKVFVYCGGVVQVREHIAGGGFCSDNSDVLHFGLNNHQIVDSVVVLFPSGIFEKRFSLDSNYRYEIVENDLTVGVSYQGSNFDQCHCADFAGTTRLSGLNFRTFDSYGRQIGSGFTPVDNWMEHVRSGLNVVSIEDLERGVSCRYKVYAYE